MSRSFHPSPRLDFVAHRRPPGGTERRGKPAAPVSDAECLDHHRRDLPGRVLLLPGDEPAVAHGECLEQAALHVVGPAPLELVLDPERHHLLADEPVAEVLLDVREPGDGLAVDQVGTVRQLEVNERRGAVAVDAGWLLGLVKAAKPIVIRSSADHFESSRGSLSESIWTLPPSGLAIVTATPRWVSS